MLYSGKCMKLIYDYHMMLCLEQSRFQRIWFKVELLLLFGVAAFRVNLYGLLTIPRCTFPRGSFPRYSVPRRTFPRRRRRRGKAAAAARLSRVDCSSTLLFPTPTPVCPKFLHVPLGVGG